MNWEKLDEEDELDEELEELEPDDELDDAEDPVDGPLFSCTVQPIRLKSSAAHSKMLTNFMMHSSFFVAEFIIPWAKKTATKILHKNQFPVAYGKKCML